jgi:hypothetical protein
VQQILINVSAEVMDINIYTNLKMVYEDKDESKDPMDRIHIISERDENEFISHTHGNKKYKSLD